MSHRSFNPKIRFLGQKVCPVARSQTDGRTERLTTVYTLSGFQDVLLQPIIKDQPNIYKGNSQLYIWIWVVLFTNWHIVFHSCEVYLFHLDCEFIHILTGLECSWQEIPNIYSWREKEKHVTVNRREGPAVGHLTPAHTGLPCLEW